MCAPQATPTNRRAQQTTDNEAACRQLEALADEMFRRDSAAQIFTGREPPCVEIVNKNNTLMRERIYAAPTSDGTWWLWWSWAEKLARLDDIAHAAGAITHVLTPAPVTGGPHLA